MFETSDRQSGMGLGAVGFWELRRRRVSSLHINNMAGSAHADA